MDTALPSPVGLLLDAMVMRVKLFVIRRESNTDSRTAFDITDTRSPEVCQRLLELLSGHGRVAYQFCVLSNASWQILWSPDRQSYLPFFEHALTLVAFCDAVGDEKDREVLLQQFLALARGKGKQAAIILATETARRAALDLGFAGFWVGTEQIIDLEEYSLSGKTGRKLRQEANHIRHLGGTAREIFPLQKQIDRQAIEQVEQLWKARLRRRYNASFLGTKPMENGQFRRYFAVETPGDPASCAVMQSFLVCSPVGGKGWYLDLVRRPGAPRGATELLILSAMEILRSEGVEFVTMGLIPFYDPAGQHAPSKAHLLMQWGVGYLDRIYHFSGMQVFRSKFSATRIENAYVLYWPSIPTPQLVWSVAAVLTTEGKAQVAEYGDPALAAFPDSLSHSQT